MAGLPVASASPLLLGPPTSGRSALLFRAALAAAAPARVLFVAPQPFQRLPGGHSHRGRRSPAGAPGQGEPRWGWGVQARAGRGARLGSHKRIQFLYPTSLQDLLRLLASLHDTVPSSPSLIVLDSLEGYLGTCPGPHVAAQLVALLLDTANHFSQKLSLEPAGCRLIISMRCPEEGGDGTEQLSAVQRYFLAQCWLHVETQENNHSDGQPVTKLVRAHLSQRITSGC